MEPGSDVAAVGWHGGRMAERRSPTVRALPTVRRTVREARPGDGCDGVLPGSAGEHALQCVYGTQARRASASTRTRYGTACSRR